MQFDTRWKIQTLWVLVLVLLVSPTHAQDEEKKKSKEEEYFELMQVFVDTFEQVERNYVKDVDRRRLIEAALRGMIKELDPYSSYISPEELARFNQRVEQQFGGVGIQVQPDPRTRRILVISPLPNTPAYKAGVRAGDIITEVEGQDTENMTLSEAVRLMKGPAGEDVSIKVRHEGSANDEGITITRAIIQVKSVLGDKYDTDGEWDLMLDKENGIGYVRLSQFGRQSADELASALKKLSDQGMRGLVLDLRFNPGGLLSQAVRVADLFIESGTIVSTEGKNSRPRTWSATKPGTFSGFPMAVLVNRYSASASEIVSACLQDHNRATIVGERSWGKGSVQNVIELESGASALKLTTAGYKRPSGKNIHRFPGASEDEEWGVHPEEGFALRFTREEMINFDKYRRDRDVLRPEGPVESDFQDTQLTKALEHVRSELSDTSEEKKKPEKSEEKTDDDDKKKAA